MNLRLGTERGQYTNRNARAALNPPSRQHARFPVIGFFFFFPIYSFRIRRPAVRRVLTTRIPRCCANDDDHHHDHGHDHQHHHYRGLRSPLVGAALRFALSVTSTGHGTTPLCSRFRVITSVFYVRAYRIRLNCYYRINAVFIRYLSIIIIVTRACRVGTKNLYLEYARIMII